MLHFFLIRYLLYFNRILPIAASTYYRTLDLTDNPEHRAKRDLHDEYHAEQIKRIWKESSGRYGVRKVWQQLKREGYVIHVVQLLD